MARASTDDGQYAGMRVEIQYCGFCLLTKPRIYFNNLKVSIYRVNDRNST